MTVIMLTYMFMHARENAAQICAIIRVLAVVVAKIKKTIVARGERDISIYYSRSRKVSANRRSQIGLNRFIPFNILR